MIGTTVAGRYEIKAQIGVGGMGIVYRAHDAKLRRDVALKVIAPHLMQQESARLRFLREAQALAGLMHPNIVTIFDMAEDGDSNTVFLVMELLSGHSLRQFLSDETCPRTLECPRFSDIALPLCRALEAAHKRGVLHRDIKPENIFVCDDGTLKLMDFGLARLLGDMSKNQSSTVAGTLAYMSPEQLRGDKLDARADLYALGVVFFEFVTGTQPFMGDNPGTVLLKHLTEPPPSLKARLPAAPNADAETTLSALDALILRMMAKEPGERPASAMEVRDTLEQSLSNGDMLALAINRLLAAQSEKGMGIAHHPTRALPTAPVSVPTENLAALLTARQTTELPLDTAPEIEVAATPASKTTTLLAEKLPAAKARESLSPAWKRRGGILVGIGVLGAASVLAISQFAPRAVPTTKEGTPPLFASKARDSRREVTSSSGTAVRSVSPPASGSSNPAAAQTKAKHDSAPSLLNKSGNVPVTPKNAAPNPTDETPLIAKDGNSTSGTAALASAKKTGSTATDKSSEATATVLNKEREALRKQQQDEMTLIQSLKEIKSLRQELKAARTMETVTGAQSKANVSAAATTVPNAKNGAQPVKPTPPKPTALPNVADEAKPSLVISMKVARVMREDTKAVHISLQNDVDCYAYFYLLPPRAREAMRLFAGYENFPAAPKTPYAIRMSLPHDVANSRGVVLIVASKKELKNLPTTFELPPPPLAITKELTGEQRQKMFRQNIHQFSDQAAQRLAARRVLLGGQLMQPHDVEVRLIGNNPMVFGRIPDGSRRGFGQPQSRRRRDLPPPVESGNTNVAH